MIRLPKIPSVEVECRKVISEDDLWLTHHPGILRAEKFEGQPSFYPVYRYQNYYSYNVLPLIQLKGSIDPDPEVVNAASDPDFQYYSGSRTIDLDICRIGGPLKTRRKLREPGELIERLIPAMRENLERVEAANPGFEHVILTGGKDSLNLLLLPWKKPPIVASAAPNYVLVKQFVQENGLGLDVIELNDDADEEELQLEAAASGCMIDLQHVRWGTSLRKISKSLGGNVVFWQGSLADLSLTSKGRDYAKAFGARKESSNDMAQQLVRRIFTRLFPKQMATARFLKDFHSALWYRGAMWQGVSHSVFRLASQSLVVSGYHGSPMYEVWSQMDYNSCIKRDLRTEIAEQLAGTDVWYPEANPGPEPSLMRQTLVCPERYFDILARAGIEARGMDRALA